MGKIHLIVGGARSGKSTYAEKCAIESNQTVTYIATALVTDENMERRIEKHKESRPSSWPTIEQYKHFGDLDQKAAFQASKVFLLDCLTIMMSNLMFDQDVDYDQISPEALEQVEIRIWNEVETLLRVMQSNDKELIIVSNEVGMGLVPSYLLGNYFRDISGRINQKVANIADEVTFVIVGQPLKLKGGQV